jgi:hypothetical protein
MHQSMGKVSIGGKQQKPCGVEVEATDRNPPSGLESWQSVKHTWPTFWIIPAADFTRGFVVKNCARLFRCLRIFRNVRSIDCNTAALIDLEAERCRLAIDRHPARTNPVLNFAPRPSACPRKVLL